MTKEKTANEEKRTASGLNTLASETMPLLRRILGRKGMMAADVLAFWGQIAGEELAAFTFPEKIGFRGKERQNGVLQVAAVNGAFALELQHRDKVVLERLTPFSATRRFPNSESVRAAGFPFAGGGKLINRNLRKYL